MSEPVNVATEVVHHVLSILERASDSWHNGVPADNGPLHWPVAVHHARRELQHALRTPNAQANERSLDERAGIAWWNHLTPAQRHHWLICARSPAPADAWEAFKSWDTQS